MSKLNNLTTYALCEFATSTTHHLSASYNAVLMVNSSPIEAVIGDHLQQQCFVFG